MPLDKLTIGTVNFGIPYGTVPGSGQVPRDEAAAIIETAAQRGLHSFDTAAAYGDAESVLGNCLKRARIPKPRVTTKLYPLPQGRFTDATAAEIRDQVELSRNRLGVAAFETLLVHHVADLLSNNGPALWDLMRRFRDDGVTRRIGVSLYDAAEIDAVLDRYNPDVMQLPISIADQRLIRSGHVATLAERGVEIHARSIFLQGVLLTTPCAIDPIFAETGREIAALDEAAETAGVDRLTLCLAFVLQMPEVSRVVVGVNSTTQFAEIADAAARDINLDGPAADRCAWPNAWLLNPLNWLSMIDPPAPEAR